MKLTVRLFAGLRERVGAPTLDLALPDDANVADLLAALEDTPLAGLPERSFIVAVNRAYAEPHAHIRPGDEVALIPPVSGGDDTVRIVRITPEPLDLAALVAAVRDPRAGAVVTFEGTTRHVDHLDYEAYEEMALERMRAIAAEEAERHDLCAIAVEHRVGRVPLSEASVLVAASAPHRPEAFTGARAVIDRLKAEVPIFKKEEGDWIGDLPAA